MNTLKIVIEIFVSIHLLLWMTPWCIHSQWLKIRPTIVLNLARLLLVSCVISPVAVHLMKPTAKPFIQKFISLDSMQNYVSRSISKTPLSSVMNHSTPSVTMPEINYWTLLSILIGMITLLRSYRIFTDLNKLKGMISTAIPYRSCRKLQIKVSKHCHIPFSVRIMNKAYIILPLSLLSSSSNVKIAIAHEGQHHRNGDCWWAYFIELINLVFFANPGVRRWKKILTELQELSCDETLVGHQNISAHDYGHCLFDVVQAVSNYPTYSQREIACTVGMALGNNKHESEFLIRRITMLTNYQSSKSKRMLLSLSLACVAVVVPLSAAYAAIGSLAGAQAKEIDSASLDPKIQQIADVEISNAVKRYHAKSGAIAVVDPNTGKIIAFAQAGKVDGTNSWKSRIFSPASTIKPFIAAVAIDSGVTSESKQYDCHAPYWVDGVKLTNHEASFGTLSVAEALAQSVSVCFAKMAQEIKPQVFRQKLTGFGFDLNSGWQSDKSDALQMAQASDGVNIPTTLESLTKTYGVLANKGRSAQGAVISATTANSVTHMLEGVVQHGTGKQAALNDVRVAGKTGTLVDTQNNMHLALFGGYVPANAPQYAMVIVIEEGYVNKNEGKSNTGGSLAAPVFRQVALKSLKIS